MGHSSLETTMGYLHGDSLNIKSPLETVLATHFDPFSQAGSASDK
jgi:hypothetical protein